MELKECWNKINAWLLKMNVKDWAGFNQSETFDIAFQRFLDDLDTSTQLHDFYSLQFGQSNYNCLRVIPGFRIMPPAFLMERWHELVEYVEENEEELTEEYATSEPKNWIKEFNNIKTTIPFATNDMGDYIAVDLDPDFDGIKGQIISFGSNENYKYVLSKSLSQFLCHISKLYESGLIAVHPSEIDPKRPQLYWQEGMLYDFLNAVRIDPKRALPGVFGGNK